jgi:hypothetical protein
VAVRVEGRKQTDEERRDGRKATYEGVSNRER